MPLDRRSFLRGLIAVVAAPAVIRTPGLLMPVRALAVAPAQIDILPGGPSPEWIEIWEHLQRVQSDLILFGAGYYRQTRDGLRHVPLSDVHTYPDVGGFRMTVGPEDYYERPLTLPATPAV